MNRPMDHDEYRDLCAGHALGSLDPPDAARLEDHLRQGCDACRADLLRHATTVERLAGALAPIAPPAGAEARLLARIAAEGPTGAPVSSPFRRRGAPARSASRWLLPAAALILTGVALWTADGSRREARRLAEALQDFETTTDPIVDRSVLQWMGPGPGARAMATHDPRTGLWRLFAHDLDPAPEGQVYQAWLLTPGGAIALGVFQADEARHGFVRWSGGEVGGVTEIRVTLEPARGSDRPTGAVVFQGGVAR